MTTNREVFEKFYATIQPSVPQAGYEDITMDAAYLAWVAAKADSEREIAELKAHINRLLEALGCLYPALSIDLKYASGDDDLVALKSRVETIEQALVATPAQSLKAHDDELIEKCAKLADVYVDSADNIRELKGE